MKNEESIEDEKSEEELIQRQIWRPRRRRKLAIIRQRSHSEKLKKLLLMRNSHSFTIEQELDIALAANEIFNKKPEERTLEVFFLI